MKGASVWRSGRDGADAAAGVSADAERLDDWRESNARGTAFPGKLWRVGGAIGEEARGICDGAGAGAGVQQTQRRQWCGSGRPGPRRKAKRPSIQKPVKFIELTDALPVSSSGCRLSLQDPSGQRLQLEMAPAPRPRWCCSCAARVGARLMIQLTAQMRILVAVASIDFRAGIDGLARVCRAQLDVDPFCGWLVVFCNRRRTRDQDFDLRWPRILGVP